MMDDRSLLHSLLSDSAAIHPDAIALRECGGSSISYRDLEELSSRLCRYLQGLGIGRGDRVGFCLGKSIDAVAAIFGILKAGAAYVPVDPASPPARSAQIFADCAIRLLILDASLPATPRSELSRLLGDFHLLALNGTGGGGFLAAAIASAQFPCNALLPVEVQPDDLAYILYTSGSTGRPKGVMLTHRNATSFVHWCSEVFFPSSADCFSSHAPLHFDLSILDLYVSIKHAATLILIDETTAKSPGLLTALVARERITIWYSTPSVLTLWLSYGKMEQHDLGSLRLVLFAGEVFPIKHLRALKEKLSHPIFYNLYGPTETNVCTYFEIPEVIPEDRTAAFPIGKTCRHLMTRVVDGDGALVSAGEEGELCVHGPAVTSGYWNRPEQTASSYLVDAAHRNWYKTGDIVVELPEGDYQFQGRRDRMIKRRGHRVELGEIEACLVRHPAIQEVAVVVRGATEEGGGVVAVLVASEGARPSLIQLKKFCSENLPASMIPDHFEFRQSLPKTSTDKIDYQDLSRPPRTV